MDVFDFGSPALQAMSVPAIVVLAVLAVLTVRSVVTGDRWATDSLIRPGSRPPASRHRRGQPGSLPGGRAC